MDEYLTEGICPVGAAEPLVDNEPVVEPPLFDENDDIAETAVHHVSQLNGREGDLTISEYQVDEEYERIQGIFDSGLRACFVMLLDMSCTMIQ